MGRESDGIPDGGLCSQTDPELFHPDPGHSTKEAKKVCLSCEVRQPCLEGALARQEKFGVWGGLGPSELKKLGRTARRA